MLVTHSQSKPAALTHLAEAPSAKSLVHRLRPYGLALLLFGAAIGLMDFAGAAYPRYALPWTLISLLLVAAVASLWGTSPAILVLAVAALFGAIIAPDMHISHVTGYNQSLHARIMRMILFLACGAATIWLTYRARLMHERSERKHEVVTALQAMILPEELAQVPGYDLSSVYQPARREEEVGGDFYDFFPIENDRYGLLIGDVMGKGKEAAASTALLRYSLRAFTSMGLPPAHVLSRLNDMIERQSIRFGTASLFFGVLDPSSGSFRYASAGHEPPLLRRADGTEETLDSTGPLLGIGLEMDFEDSEIQIEPNDELLFMTDGVTEARDDKGGFLGSEGVWRLLRASVCNESAAVTLNTLTRALTAHIGHNNRDDIAMLLLRRKPAAPTGIDHADHPTAASTLTGSARRD